MLCILNGNDKRGFTHYKGTVEETREGNVYAASKFTE